MLVSKELENSGVICPPQFYVRQCITRAKYNATIALKIHKIHKSDLIVRKGNHNI
jgi:hypothetical protein